MSAKPVADSPAHKFDQLSDTLAALGRAADLQPGQGVASPAPVEPVYETTNSHAQTQGPTRGTDAVSSVEEMVLHPDILGRHNVSNDGNGSSRGTSTDEARSGLAHETDEIHSVDGVAGHQPATPGDLDSRLEGANRDGASVGTDGRQLVHQFKADSLPLTDGALALANRPVNVVAFPERKLHAVAKSESKAKPVAAKTATRKERKARVKSPKTPDRNDVKTLLPETERGCYLELRSSDRGFVPHLRWRENKKLQDFPFEYLGKRELATIQKGSIYEQQCDLYDRLVGELDRAGRADFATRLQEPVENDQGSLRTDRRVA